MRTLNRAVLNACIDEIAALDLTERAKLDRMARFWFGADGPKTWPLPGSGHAYASMREQPRLEENVSTPEEVRELPHPFMVGVVPPSLRTKEARDILIEEFEKAVNEKAGHGGEKVIVMSEEVKSFLLYVNGVESPNFHRDWICGWDIEIGEEEDGFVDEKERRERFLGTFGLGGLLIDQEELSEQSSCLQFQQEFEVKVAIQAGDSTDGKCISVKCKTPIQTLSRPNFAQLRSAAAASMSAHKSSHHSPWVATAFPSY
jgi:hypothetical protein